MKLAKYLSITGISDILNFINVLVSLGMSLLHIMDTYSWESDDMIVRNQNPLFNTIELIFVFYFIGDFALNLYISENKI